MKRTAPSIITTDPREDQEVPMRCAEAAEEIFQFSFINGNPKTKRIKDKGKPLKDVAGTTRRCLRSFFKRYKTDQWNKSVFVKTSARKAIQKQNKTKKKPGDDQRKQCFSIRLWSICQELQHRTEKNLHNWTRPLSVRNAFGIRNIVLNSDGKHWAPIWRLSCLNTCR